MAVDRIGRICKRRLIVRAICFPNSDDVALYTHKINAVTAVRSKSEQFQLLIVSAIAGFVGNRENHRLDRHFLKYCDRKDL